MGGVRVITKQARRIHSHMTRREGFRATLDPDGCLGFALHEHGWGVTEPDRKLPDIASSPRT